MGATSGAKRPLRAPGSSPGTSPTSKLTAIDCRPPSDPLATSTRQSRIEEIASASSSLAAAAASGPASASGCGAPARQAEAEGAAGGWRLVRRAKRAARSLFPYA